MTEYVVDASVAIQHFITDTYTANADALFVQLGNSVELYVPEFCIVECTNVLWKEVRLRGMPHTTAEKMVNDLTTLPLTILSVSDLLKRALQIGLSYQLVIYDSVYIAVAESLGYPLITADAKQATVAKTIGVTLKPITDFTP